MPRKLSKPEQRERQLDRQIEKRISFIRKNPRLDKYGRPIPDGSPIGMGDKNWIKNFIEEQKSKDDSQKDLTMTSTKELNTMLNKLVKAESYEAAAKIRDELSRRK